MKPVVFLIFCLSVVHQASSEASSSEEERDNAQNRLNTSMHLDCFDVFLPLINRLANEAKDAADKCVNTASSEKERELTTVKNTRTELHTEVKRIKETLQQCSAKTDHVGYFECLNGIIEHDRKIVAEIATKSSNYSLKVKKIEEQELQCFRSSVVKLKEKISNGVNNLHYCLMSENVPSPTTGSRLPLPHQPSRDLPGHHPFYTTTTTTEGPLVQENYDEYNY